MTQVGARLTEDQFNRTISPFQLDLMAYYNLLMEDAMKVLNKAEEEGKTPEEFIQEIQELFSD